MIKTIIICPDCKSEMTVAKTGAMFCPRCKTYKAMWRERKEIKQQ